ncbi:MAG: histidinol-phosphatase [Salaquimonas sp.]
MSDPSSHVGLLSSADIAKAIDTLCSLAETETIKHFRAPLEISNKLQKGFDPVTVADKAAEAVIRRYIMERFPDHGILGEEEEPFQIDADYCWIIDPIDGTRAFISGLPTWGTLIGLNFKGKPIAGVMHQPFTEEKYICDSQNVYLQHQGKKSGLRTSAKTQLSEATIMSTAPELFSGKDQTAFEALKNKCQLTRFGFDCYAYAMVAAGNIELVVECGLNAYDIAPLIPIIEKAGGLVTSWDGSSAANGGKVIAAANPELLQAALEILRPYA